MLCLLVVKLLYLSCTYKQKETKISNCHLAEDILVKEAKGIWTLFRAKLSMYISHEFEQYMLIYSLSLGLMCQFKGVGSL